MFCPKCGKENQDNAAFCMDCGNNLSNEIKPTPEAAPVQEEAPAVEEQPVVTNTEVVPETPAPSTEKKPKKKVMMFIIIGLLAVAIIFVILYFFVFKSPKSVTDIAINNYFDPDSPIVVGEAEKYGLISPEGKEILKQENAYVGSCYDNLCFYAKSKEDGLLGKFTFIDYKGKTVKVMQSKAAVAPVHYIDTWIIGDILYDKDLNEIFKADDLEAIGYGYIAFADETNKRVGIIDRTGKTVFTSEGDYIIAKASENDITDDDYYFKVFVEGKVQGIFSTKKGEIVYNVKDTEESVISVKEDNIFAIQLDDDYNYNYLYFKDGKVIYESKDSFEVADYKDNIIKIDYNEYYDINNKKKMDSFDSLTTRENIYKTKYNIELKEVNYIDKLMVDNKEALDKVYTEIALIDADVFAYMLNNKNKKIVIGLDESQNTCSVINVKGKAKEIKVVPECEDIKDDYNLTLVFELTNGNYYLYNLLTDEGLVVNQYNSIATFSNYVIVDENSNNTKKYFNNSFKEIYKTEITKPQEISSDEQSKKVNFEVWGTTTKNGKGCIYGKIDSGVLKEGSSLKLYTFNDGVISFKVDELYVNDVRLSQSANNSDTCIYSKSLDLSKVEEDNIISNDDTLMYGNKFNIKVSFYDIDEDSLKNLCDGEESLVKIDYSRSVRATFKCKSTQMQEDEYLYGGIIMTTANNVPIYKTDEPVVYRDGSSIGEITVLSAAK